jgi:hypothetical protein
MLARQRSSLLLFSISRLYRRPWLLLLLLLPSPPLMVGIEKVWEKSK